MIDIFLKRLKEKGWRIERNELPDSPLPIAIRSRYTNIPKQWQEFIGKVRYMLNADETTWFLGINDFKLQDDAVFRWNEWELISLESAEGDTEWSREIKSFWDGHLPIVMSVKGGYSYYAICMEDGSIVQGFEPEFEECAVVADSFGGFMKKILEDKLQL